MGDYLKRAAELRAIVEPHYSCAQSVFVPFGEQLGLTHEQAFNIARAFGGGMQTGNVCGALAGALMALGLAGVADRQTVVEAIRRMQENHEGVITCAELLRLNDEKGGQKKLHCDALVQEAVGIVEELLDPGEQGTGCKG